MVPMGWLRKVFELRGSELRQNGEGFIMAVNREKNYLHAKAVKGFAKNAVAVGSLLV